MRFRARAYHTAPFAVEPPFPSLTCAFCLLQIRRRDARRCCASRASGRSPPFPAISIFFSISELALKHRRPTASPKRWRSKFRALLRRSSAHDCYLCVMLLIADSPRDEAQVCVELCSLWLYRELLLKLLSKLFFLVASSPSPAHSLIAPPLSMQVTR